MLREMLREEWRMHARLFSGRSFVMFPVMLFGLVAGFAFLVSRYATLPVQEIGTGLVFLGGFMGLSVGAVGFTSRDAFRNVLGPTNFLVYSSRTLPLSERRLLATFLLKDIIYYVGLFLLPISVAALLFAGPAVLGGVTGMIGAFLAGLVVAAAVARSSLRVPTLVNIRYDARGRSPLAAKALVDLFRSSGGVFKVVFSMLILAGAYWFFVLYFPAMRIFLERPLLSFSILVGTLSLSIYNWMNRFDAPDDYTHLPVDEHILLRAKQEAFLLVSIPLVLLFILASTIVYPAEILLAAVTGVATTVYTLGVATVLLGVRPNTALYETRTFLTYLVLNALAVVPLLVLSVFYLPTIRPIYTTAVFAVMLVGVFLITRR